MNELLFDHFDSPVGTILITAVDGKLCSLDYGDYDERMQRLLTHRMGEFVRLPHRDPFGFRQMRYIRDVEDSKALNFLRESAIIISASGMCESGRILHHLKNNIDPVGIVVPCHRVIGADGTLTGYAGGLHRKEWLLRHEGVDLDAILSKTKRTPDSHVQSALF